MVDRTRALRRPSLPVAGTNPLGSRERPEEEGHRPKPPKKKRKPIHHRRWGIFDLLFVEVDALDGLDRQQKSQLKRDIRQFFRPKAPTRPSAPRPETDADGTIDRIDETAERKAPKDQPPSTTASEPNLADLAMPIRNGATVEELLGSLRLARQLQACLAQNTDTARRIARYLKALLLLHGERFEPRFRVDV